MKQTKKLTRNQREYLKRYHNVDTSKARLVEETKDYIKVQSCQYTNMRIHEAFQSSERLSDNEPTYLPYQFRYYSQS